MRARTIVTSEDSPGAQQSSKIRALAHPARLGIVEHLSTSGKPATATELAEIVGLSVSATSWHLRTLAKNGMITQAAGRGDGRERLWQVAGAGITIEHEADAPKETGEAVRAYLGMACARADTRLQTWLDHEADEDETWRAGLRVGDERLLITPAELRELNERYDALIAPYLDRARSQPPTEARPVFVHLRLIPEAES